MPANDSLQPALVNTVQRRMDEAAAISASVTGPGQRVWQYPGTVAPSDVPRLGSSFDRTQIDEAYVATLSDASNPGTSADAMALKLQADRLAAEERAFRLRHCSPVRASVHAAARRSGHSSPAGVFGGCLQRYLEDIVREGAQ